MWHGKLLPSGDGIITSQFNVPIKTVIYEIGILGAFSGSLQVVDRSGELLHSAPLDKVKHISSLVHVGLLYHGDQELPGLNISLQGERLVALGSSQGCIYVVDPHTLAILYTVESHAMKIRCLAFTKEDTRLLSGSDDKTIKLHSLTDTRGSVERSYCGHTSGVVALRVEERSAGERFASACTDGKLILWSTENGKILHIFCNKDSDIVSAILRVLASLEIDALSLVPLNCIHT